MDYTTISFKLWRDIGLINGFISPPVCATHDGVPTSAEEDELVEEGEDPCFHIMRLYESAEHKKAVEENHAPSVWRNPLCNP